MYCLRESGLARRSYRSPLLHDCRAADRGNPAGGSRRPREAALEHHEGSDAALDGEQAAQHCGLSIEPTSDNRLAVWSLAAHDGVRRALAAGDTYIAI